MALVQTPKSAAQWTKGLDCESWCDSLQRLSLVAMPIRSHPVIFVETPLQGAFVIELEAYPTSGGSSRARGVRTSSPAGASSRRFVQSSISFNHRAGTLRGMHYQAAPWEETKLVRCTRGAIFDVIIDLRPDSPTRARHYGAMLSESNRLMLYVPRGFAHGFQTLEDATEVEYQVSEFYRPEAARGVRWDDPTFAIAWPAADHRIMLPRDRNYPDFVPDTMDNTT